METLSSGLQNTSLLSKAHQRAKERQNAAPLAAAAGVVGKDEIRPSLRLEAEAAFVCAVRWPVDLALRVALQRCGVDDIDLALGLYGTWGDDRDQIRSRLNSQTEKK